MTRLSLKSKRSMLLLASRKLNYFIISKQPAFVSVSWSISEALEP